MAYIWCDSTDSLRDWADGLAPDQPLYLDTEFMRERTYFPRLALVQVHDGEHIRLIDTTRVDPPALVPLFAERPLIMHACSEDLEALASFAGAYPERVRDTQIAAALTGEDMQVGYQRLVDQFTYTQDQLSKMIGKSRSHVANTLRLLGLPPGVQDLLSNGALSAGHARALIGHPQAEKLAKEVADKGLSVREAEALTRKPETSAPTAKGGSSPKLKDADTVALEKNITNALGLSVSINHKGEKGGTVNVSYTSLEQLDEICRRLSRV